MKIITSANNSYIKDLIKLKQKKYRDLNKLYLVEGYNILEEAKEYVKTILVSDKEDIEKYKKFNNAEIILVSEEVIKKLASTQTPQGVIGVCKYKDPKEVNGKVVMLDGVQDPGNIGTIIRTSIAFGYDTVIMSENCVDIYNDKVIRATQGAIFKTNVLRCDLKDAIRKLKGDGYYVVGTSLRNAILLNDLDIRVNNIKDKHVLVLGSEGQGMSEEILGITDVNVFIPISKEMESLNVGVASGIMMYYLNN